MTQHAPPVPVTLRKDLARSIRQGAYSSTFWICSWDVSPPVTLVSVSALREVARWTSLDTAALIARHVEAREIAGFGLFLAFAVVNFAVIGACVWAVRRGNA